jgi:hypothetical protein
MQNYAKILNFSIFNQFWGDFFKKIEKYVKNIQKLLVNEKVLCYNKNESKNNQG